MAEHAVAEHQPQARRAQRRQQLPSPCREEASAARPRSPAAKPPPGALPDIRIRYRSRAPRRGSRAGAHSRRRTAARSCDPPPKAWRWSGHGRSAGWCPRRPGWQARRRRRGAAAPSRTPAAPAARGCRPRRVVRAMRRRTPAESRPRPGRAARAAAHRHGPRRRRAAACSTARGVVAAVPATRSSLSGNLSRERSFADISRSRWPSRARPAGWRDR